MGDTMLGKMPEQYDIFESGFSYSKILRTGSFHEYLYKNREKIVNDEQFTDCYCLNNGRPSVPPSQLTLITLLQMHDRKSDRTVLEAINYDLRYKIILRLKPEEVDPYKRTTLQEFRYRVILNKKDRDLFEKSLKIASEAGYISKQIMLGTDTSPIYGRGAVRDTYNLIGDAIKKAIQQIAAFKDTDTQEYAEKRGLGYYFDKSVKGSIGVDWSDQEQIEEF